MNKLLKVSIISLLLCLLLCFTSFAGAWRKDEKGWWYQNTNGTYLKTGWYWIDGKCYYFDDNGYCLQHTTTPDGYIVNRKGEWVVDNKVKERLTKLTTSYFTVKIPNGYDYEVKNLDDSIVLKETNGNLGIMLLSVNEPNIQDIFDTFGEEGLELVSDELSASILSEISDSVELITKEILETEKDSWYKYNFRVKNKTNENVSCDVYLTFEDITVKIVICPNSVSREFLSNDDFIKFYLE